jgi:hypothetical protein
MSLSDRFSDLVVTVCFTHIDQVEEGKMGRYVAHMGEVRNAYKILIRKPEGKREETNWKSYL